MIFVLVASLIIALFAYIFLPAKIPPAKKVDAIQPAPTIKKTSIKRPAVPKLVILQDGKVIIPPGIPRNMFTIKIMAEETPDLVINVVKNWLKKGQADNAGSGSFVDKKELAKYLKNRGH